MSEKLVKHLHVVLHIVRQPKLLHVLLEGTIAVCDFISANAAQSTSKHMGAPHPLGRGCIINMHSNMYSCLVDETVFCLGFVRSTLLTLCDTSPVMCHGVTTRIARSANIAVSGQ